MNLALESLIEQQRTWGVSDVALRANLRDAILEDCLSAYKVTAGPLSALSPSAGRLPAHHSPAQAFWRKYEVLPFTKSVHKYLRYPPDALAKIVMDDLFESHTGPEDVSNTGPSFVRAGLLEVSWPR